MGSVFEAIAEDTRRRILDALRQAGTDEREQGGEADHLGVGELSVGELVEAVGVTQPTVSKHLKVLREVGLVGVREDGQRRFYHVDPRALEPVSSWISAFSAQIAPVEAEFKSVPSVSERLGTPLPSPVRVAGGRVGGAIAAVGQATGRAVRQVRTLVVDPIRERFGRPRR